MYKIGIIGERDSVLGFMALGFSVHEAQDAEQAAKKLQALVKSGEYAVIFLTENYAQLLEEETNRILYCKVTLGLHLLRSVIDRVEGRRLVAESGVANIEEESRRIDTHTRHQGNIAIVKGYIHPKPILHIRLLRLVENKDRSTKQAQRADIEACRYGHLQPLDRDTPRGEVAIGGVEPEGVVARGDINLGLYVQHTRDREPQYHAKLITHLTTIRRAYQQPIDGLWLKIIDTRHSTTAQAESYLPLRQRNTGAEQNQNSETLFHFVCTFNR